MISVIRAFQYVCDGMQIIWAQMLIPYDKNMEVWSMDLTLSTKLDLDFIITNFIITRRQLTIVTMSK